MWLFYLWKTTEMRICAPLVKVCGKCVEERGGWGKCGGPYSKTYSNS